MTESDEPEIFDDKEMMKLFMELHSGNPREGPGDDKCTLRALGMIDNVPERPDILDVGCGPGMQTIALAEATGGRIIAVDIFQHFLDQLERSARERVVGERIRTLKGDMSNLPFEPESFDLIWSEGAIYIMGFENGLREWGRFLRSGGVLAVTHVSWLREDVPDTLYDWWMENCPDIRQIKENLAIIEACGYEVLGHFTLPESAWWDGYYASLTKGMERMRERYPDDTKVEELIRMELDEQRMYWEYSDYYGYVFFVMRRIESDA